MYALVKTGGKQYRVAKDDTILVERIAANEGAEVILNDIVMLADGDKVTIGTPKVEGAAVSATVMRQRGTKVRPGDNVGMGKDHTLFALIEGQVAFREKSGGKMFVNVVPMAKAAE